MSRDKDVWLSKRLSWLLRHGATKEGFVLEQGGFLNVSDVLKHKSFRQYSLSDIERVVANNDKKRFSLRTKPGTDQIQICANQGHSVEVELDLQPITSPSEIPVVIHGTYAKFMKDIREMGISRMKRQHIHFACGEPGEEGVISGMRRSCNTYIYIDAEKAMNDGFKFYISTNNVILCPGNERGYLPPAYFSNIVERKRQF